MTVQTQHNASGGMTGFIVALMKMTHTQRAQASAARAAERYGIREDWAQWWIEQANTLPEVWPISNG